MQRVMNKKEEKRKEKQIGKTRKMKEEIKNYEKVQIKIT